MAAFESEPAIVPAIWSLELANALLEKERAKVITRKEVDELPARRSKMPVTVDTSGPAGTFSDTLRLTRKHHLSVYDASYLELAVRQKAPLSAAILALALERGRVTVRDVVASEGANRNTIELHLEQLVAAGHLVLRGQGRGTWYERT